MTNWKITLNDAQLKLINRALEFYFRATMGQEMYVVDELCDDAIGMGNDDFCRTRNDAQEVLRAAFRIIHGVYGSPREKSHTCMAIIDMWSAIRYAIWKDRPEPKSHDTVDSRKPYCESGLPIIKVERVKE